MLKNTKKQEDKNKIEKDIQKKIKDNTHIVDKEDYTGLDLDLYSKVLKSLLSRGPQKYK